MSGISQELVQTRRKEVAPALQESEIKREVFYVICAVLLRRANTHTSIRIGGWSVCLALALELDY
jgi:hypothetical protein